MPAAIHFGQSAVRVEPVRARVKGDREVRRLETNSGPGETVRQQVVRKSTIVAAESGDADRHRAIAR